MGLEQIVPWLLGLGNLVWNYVNHRRTTQFQRDQRQESVRLEEFRRIRSAIDACLADLSSERDTLRSLSVSGVDLLKLREQVGEQQRRILSIYFRTEAALKRADESRYASGNDWVAIIEGGWDEFLEAIDRTYNPNRPERETRQAPGLAADKLTQMISAVEARIERELASYTGDRG